MVYVMTEGYRIAKRDEAFFASKKEKEFNLKNTSTHLYPHFLGSLYIAPSS